MKKAMITGITGQDGSYLAELLLSKGYEVHGIIRRASTFNTARIDPIFQSPQVGDDKRLYLHYGDLSDSNQLSNLITNIQPEEVYNLGAQSHVRVSFDIPEYTANVVANGVTRILEVVRRCSPHTKIYQASSSEMFGSSSPPQGEDTSFNPRSPYACAKVFGHWMVKNYREGYDMFASNGILFNHESPRRGETFVTRKVTRGVSAILSGKQDKLYLGNLDARRDWGFAPEYVEVMWRIMQLEEPGDFIIGTGGTNSVREFVEAAFEYVGLDDKDHVEIDPRYYRPTEVEDLIADTTYSKEMLAWEPKIGFTELVKVMMDADMRSYGLEPVGEGDRILRETFPEKWWQGD